MAIQRRTLRAEIRDEVLRRLSSGEFEHGANINEVQLAGELGVSRTPLREALIALENEGITESVPGKGFRWARVSEQELLDLLPIVAALEALALRQTDPDDLAAVAADLGAAAAAFSASAARHGEIIARDDEWHAMLLSRCPNERLLDLIAGLKVALRRYERLVVPDEESLGRAASEHREIARCLAARDVEGAVDRLNENWSNGLTRLVAAAARHREIA